MLTDRTIKNYHSFKQKRIRLFSANIRCRWSYNIKHSRSEEHVNSANLEFGVAFLIENTLAEKKAVHKTPYPESDEPDLIT